MHADEQQPELPHPEDQSDGDDPPPPHRRSAHQEDGGHGRREESQGAEEQGWEVVEAHVDDDEVDAPYGGDEDGESDVHRAHVIKPCRPDSVAPAHIPS
ncbi:hypothetical protein GCM10009544_40170 [Streptomyces stramineus]|uniref:Uncharacterized protein n=1 Tax=Streptomyces stramineus TaxID=173861 RepID=A0ABN1AE05_9ACTN